MNWIVNQMRLRISLSAKIFWGFAIVLFPILVTWIIGYRSNRAHLERLVFDDLAVIADSYEGQVYQFIEMSKRRAQDFSSDGLIRDHLQKIGQGQKSAAPALNDHLIKNKLSLDKTIHSIYVVSMNGRIVASTDNAALGRDVSGEYFFTHGRDKPSVDASAAGGIGSPSLAASSPITDRVTRKTIGVLVNSILLTELRKVLSGDFSKELGAVPRSKIKRRSTDAYIVNKDKMVITGSKSPKGPESSRIIDTPMINACLESGVEGAGLYKNYRGVEVAGAVICMPSMNWALVVDIPKGEVFAPVYMMRRQALIAGIIITGLIVIVNLFYYFGIVRPVKTVSETAEAIAGGDFKRHLEVKTGDEIEKLADSINNMALGIEGAIVNLEGLVQQRTEELAVANEEMMAANKELQVLYSQMEATAAELEEVNRRFAEANDELKSLERLKTNFLHTISHELRSPLSPILGYLEMMRDGGTGELTSKQKDILAEMHLCGRNMQLLIDELLEVASIQAGNLSLEFKEVDLHPILLHAVKEVRKYADEISSEVEVKLPPDKVILVADRKSLLGIFTHLLRNAVKFSRHGGKITVEAFPRHDVIEVTVSDRGIGIPKDRLEKIFDVFYQVDSSATRRYEGVGLGLYLVKRLVDLHKGSIRVESKEGEGTSFTVFIPRRRKSDA